MRTVRLNIIKGEQGIEVNVEDSIAAIENYISSEWDGGNAEIELVAEVVEPRGSRGDLEQITDMMGKLYDELQGFRSEPL